MTPRNVNGYFYFRIGIVALSYQNEELIIIYIATTSSRDRIHSHSQASTINIRSHTIDIEILHIKNKVNTIFK